MLYAAEFANFLRNRAIERAQERRRQREEAQPGATVRARARRSPGPGAKPEVLESLRDGLIGLSEDLRIPLSTLRYAADGDGWPSLYVVATVEMHFERPSVDYATVITRQSRGGRTLYPAPPVERRRRRTSPSSPPHE
ncbi:MAG: hypothetical protein BGO38_01290 [Cellulomonas sp. 73-145]|nr:MAG: hypothetical protein BGO38_01290 [Cellulomonas sp. 73-145]